MSEDDRLPERAHIPIRHRLRLFRALRAEEAAPPRSVEQVRASGISPLMSTKSGALARRALDLAREGREDPAAVGELVDLAGRRGEHRLVRASEWCAWLGKSDAGRIPDRARRLLEAAARRGPIEPVTPEEEAWFMELERFESLSESSAYAELVRREPALEEVEPAVRELTRSEVLVGMTQEDRDERVLGFIIERIDPLLGDEARSEDPIVRLHIVHGVARVHLATLADVRLLSDEEIQAGLDAFRYGWGGGRR